MNSTVPSVVSFGTLAGLSIWRNLAILQMSDKKLPLTIFLLKPDRVPVFESQLETEIRQSLPLAAPLDGYVISFPSKPIVPLWASILNNLLQKPGSLSAVGSSPAALMVIKQD